MTAWKGSDKYRVAERHKEQRNGDRVAGLDPPDGIPSVIVVFIRIGG